MASSPRQSSGRRRTNQTPGERLPPPADISGYKLGEMTASSSGDTLGRWHSLTTVLPLPPQCLLLLLSEWHLLGCTGGLMSEACWATREAGPGEEMGRTAQGRPCVQWEPSHICYGQSSRSAWCRHDRLTRLPVLVARGLHIGPCVGWTENKETLGRGEGALAGMKCKYITKGRNEANHWNCEKKPRHSHSKTLGKREMSSFPLLFI